MPRHLTYRMWILVLAIGLSGAALVSIPGRALADGNGIADGDDREPEGIDPRGSGDPDVPATGGRSPSERPGGSMRGSSSRLNSRNVGDVAGQQQVGAWIKFQVAMRIVRAYWLRY